MKDSQRKDAALAALRFLPMKWAIIFICLAIAYVLLQPRVNQWFGWHLPSVPGMLGEETKPAAAKGSKAKPSRSNSEDKSSLDEDEDVSPKTRKSNESSTKSKSTEKPKSAEKSPSKSTLDKNIFDDLQDEDANESAKTSTKSKGNTKASSKEPVENDFPTYGFLKPTGRDRYVSPGGLMYGPGSEEGHRLRHIERHLTDQPDRPGSHGVFDGDMHEFLVAIDDAYLRARGHAKGTTKREEEGSEVYEAPFTKKIGYMGGEQGAKRNNPPLKRLRIVVRGDSLITAFPVQ